MAVQTRQIQIRKLNLNEFQSCPIMNLWALSQLNDLEFLPGDTLSQCWIHRHLAGFLFGKQTEKTTRNTVTNGIRRHERIPNLVLYGDLVRVAARVDNDEEEQ